MKVFVTGHLGYIGPHLISLLKAYGITVTACDLNLFQESLIDDLVRPDKEIRDDFRKLSEKNLEGHDALIHLAAISNDPMGDIDPALTYDINCTASLELAKKAKKTGIPLFLYSSSCSVYGKGINAFNDETSPLNPITQYAQSKIDAEKIISDLADENFTPAYLRNATAYGYSPQFRIDLVVNNLLTCALVKNKIEIKSDGEPWRPLIHCYDIAKAFVAFLYSRKESIANRPINIGNNESNYQVKEIAGMVKKLLPSSEIIFTGESGEDPRNYRVNFNLFRELFPSFTFDYTLEKGMVEMLERLRKINFSLSDFEGDRFIRVKLLKRRLAMLITEYQDHR